MNEYRELTKNIRAPHGLHRQVLAAVEKHENMCLRKRKGQTLMRTAVCTACALALLLGTWTLHAEPVGEPGEGAVPGGVGIPVAEYTFALTAYAAENTVNGGIALLWENGCGKFRVAGSGVRQIVLSVDHGVLLRNGEEVVVPLTDAFDPESVYGLAAESGLAESLDGTLLTLTAVYIDGTTETHRYPITAERMRSFANEDGGKALSPTLTGDEKGTVESLYTCSAESIWLTWPVAGSSTVSLSRGFGGCMRAADGGMLVHAGIDIPGKNGMEITAAASGTVTEMGFDTSKGNYLVLDHGNGLTTLYAHCLHLLTEKGRQVKAGECIALMGSTGISTGPHLHFEVRRDGTPENPIAYFDRTVRDTLHAE